MKDPLPGLEAAGKKHVAALTSFLNTRSKLYQLDRDGKRGSEEWNMAKLICGWAKTAYEEAKAEDDRVHRDALAILEEHLPH